jgi:predicted enzyme related to lactoylglutathione lyase
MTQNERQRTDSDTGTAQTHAIDHGTLSYLQIPAVDVQESAAFYQKVFGWKIDAGHPGFEAPGDLIGQWVSERASSRETGLLPWIYVDRIDASLEQIAAHGGQVLQPPFQDGPRWLATFRDPGGNEIGVWQEGPR